MECLLTWKQILNIVGSARQSSQKCTVRVLDTVFLEQEADDFLIHWFFTTKNGTISKKKKDKCSLSAVSERFSRFSLANPNNAEKFVTVNITSDGHRKFLDQTKSNTLFNKSYIDLDPDSFLQVFLRPLNGQSHLIRARCNLMENGRNNITVSIEGRGGSPPELSIDASDQAKYFCHELSNFFSSDSSDFKLIELEVECILDDNRHVWISNIPHCAVVLKADAESGGRASPISILPELTKSLSRAKLTSGGTIRESSPRAHSADGTSQQSKLIQRLEGGAVHSCLKGPDELPGLRAWVLDSIPGNDGKTSLAWGVDMNAFHNAMSPNSNIEKVRQQRSTIRKTVPHALLSFLRLAEPLMMGTDSNIDTENDFILGWKTIFHAWVASQNIINKSDHEKDGLISRQTLDAILLQSHQVTVDGNCHAVCQKLESLIEAGFNATAPSGNFAVGEGSRGASAQAAARKLEKDDPERLVLSAGNNKGVADASSGLHRAGGPPIVPHENTWDDISAVSSLGDDSVTKKVGGKRVLKDSTPVYNIYRAESPHNTKNDSPNKIIKRNGETITRAKKSKKPLIKHPPAEIASIELIAKFAAAKELEQKRLNELEEGSEIRVDKTDRIPFREAPLSPDAVAEKAADPLGSDAVFLKNEKRKFEYQHQPRGPSLERKGGQKQRRETKQKNYDESSGHSLHHQPHFSPLDENWNEARSNAIAPFPVYSYDQTVGFMHSAQNMNNDNASLTGSEANFMLRHANSGDFSHTDNDGDDVIKAIMAPKENGTLSDKLNDTMKQKLASLEQQVNNLMSRLEKREGELQKSEEKYRKLQTEKNSLVTSNNKEIARLQEQHERDLLKLKSNFAEQLSNLVSDPSAIEAAAKNVTNGADGASNGTVTRQESSIQATSQLIQQMDDMRAEMRRQAEDAAAERRQYTAEHSLKMMNLERSFKIELNEQKTLTAALEDKLKDTEDQLVDAKSQGNTARILCSQIEQKYKEALEVQTKLKNDLKIMQTSVGNTYRLESAQEIGVGVDADTAIRLAEAKSEAKIRQIQIKCDFMRSQLEAEHAAQEQLHQALDVKRKEYEELKNDFRTRVREMEQEKQQAVEDAERQTELHFEERMIELAALQSKFVTLQGQMQEALQDNNMSKQREEAAKANALKAQTQQANLRAELNQAKKALEELRMQRDEGTAKESSNQSNEAMLRRLDNERTYLKSQLSSEITHKTELQTTLRQCQQQLADQQRQWTADVESLKETIARQEQEAVSMEQKLSLKVSALEEEEKRLKGQNIELRDGFKKMRDQLRIEELNMENIRTANRRLLEEVEGGRKELARLRAAEEAASLMSRQQAGLMTDSLSALEQKANAEVAHLRAELSKQYVINAQSQREVLDIKSKFDNERVRLDKILCAGRLLHSFKRMYISRLASTFRLWYNKSVLVDVASQFKETLKNAINRTQEQDKSDAEEALSQLRAELTRERSSRLNEAAKEAEIRLSQALADADALRLENLDELRSELEQVARTREAEWMQRYNSAEDWTRVLLEQESKKKEELSAWYDRKHEEERARRDEQEKENIAIAREKAIAEEDARWTEVRRQLELEHEVHLERSLRTVEEAHLHKIKVLTAKLTEEKEAALAVQEDKHCSAFADAEKKHEENIEALRGVHLDEMRDLTTAAQSKLNSELSKQKHELHELHEKRIRALREQWEAELQSRMEEHEIELTKLFNEKAEKLDNSVEAERKKAEALEAAKWRQALKDAEKRYKLDLQQVRAMAWSERDQEAKIELAGAIADGKRSLQSALDKNKEVIEEMKLSFSNQIENMTARFESESEEAVRVAVVNAKAELNNHWEKEFSLKIAEAEKKAQQQWSLKYNKEKELTEKLRSDIAKQAQAHAEERNTLQEKINGNDQIIKRLEEDHKHEIKSLERDHERIMDNLDVRFQNSKKVWQSEEDKRREDELAAAKSLWEAETKVRIQQVKTDLETEMELEMSKVKEESDQLVTGLEAAMSNLSSEKKALVDDLERAAERLEELEDAQFDLQQELKLKAKEMSFALWKIAAGTMALKIQFKKVMDDTQTKTEELLGSTKSILTGKLEKVTLLGLRLSGLLAESESSRVSMYEAITNFKSALLVEKRAQIRMTELELDRLTSDREVMEEERLSLLDEIGGQNGLESQVEDVEEQMREHTNSSTVMQNGRINVAHAKKKKRLDSELERILELIEEKKSQVSALEQRADAVQTRREEKEIILIDLEKELVQILIDQQRLVLGLVEDGKLIAEKAKHVAHQYNFPWPPVEHPTSENAKELVAATSGL